MSAPTFTEIELVLWPKGLRRDIWMIVDAARDPRIFPALLDYHVEYTCLYSGPLHPQLELAAPYLVRLDYEHSGSRRLIRDAWGNSWGVFLKADTGKERLRKHLRGFLVVKDQRNRRLVFRYYDPRVLNVYLPTCTGDELETVFGPVERFWAENAAGDAWHEFRVEGRSLVSETRSFTSS